MRLLLLKMSETNPETPAESSVAGAPENPEAKLLESIESSAGKTGPRRGRKKVLYIVILVLVLILGLALAKEGFHPFPVIPPTPAYP